MAKQKPGGGFLFNVFNIGFTVVMFALPTVLLAYWYFYIRDPGGGAQQVVIVQQRPEPKQPEPVDPVMTDRQGQTGVSSSIKSTGIFSETPDEMTPSQQRNSTAARDEIKQRQPASREERPLRTWTDVSGSFSVEAKFYSMTGDQVKLVLPDDRKVEVPIAKLSEEDKTYLRGVLKAKGIQASF